MTICEDCRLNDCDSCYESDCACNLASHTLSAAAALKDGAVLIEGCEDVGALLSTDDSTEFNVVLNGRTYHVTVKA